MAALPIFRLTNRPERSAYVRQRVKEFGEGIARMFSLAIDEPSRRALGLAQTNGAVLVIVDALIQRRLAAVRAFLGTPDGGRAAPRAPNTQVVDRIRQARDAQTEPWQRKMLDAVLQDWREGTPLATLLRGVMPMAYDPREDRREFQHLAVSIIMEACGFSDDKIDNVRPRGFQEMLAATSLRTFLHAARSRRPRAKTAAQPRAHGQPSTQPAAPQQPSSLAPPSGPTRATAAAAPTPAQARASLAVPPPNPVLLGQALPRQELPRDQGVPQGSR